MIFKNLETVAYQEKISNHIHIHDTKMTEANFEKRQIRTKSCSSSAVTFSPKKWAIETMKFQGEEY